MLYKTTPTIRGGSKVSKGTDRGFQVIATISQTGAFKMRPGATQRDRAFVEDESARNTEGMRTCEAIADLPKAALASLREDYGIVPPAL